MEETLTVVAAIIEHKRRCLILKRAPHKENPDLWEFPGGKLQPGESMQQALERELLEELGIKAAVGQVLGSSDTVVGGKLIRLIALQAVLDRDPTQLKDHSEMKWVSWEELKSYPLTMPDLGLFKSLQSLREMELTQLDIGSCAKFYGILYALVGIFMAAFLMVSPSSFAGFLSLTQKIMVVALMPFVNFFAGAFMGATVAFFYNLFASLFGGLKMRWR